MASKTFKARGGRRRGTVLATGLLLLFGQLIGAGHLHRYQFRTGVFATGPATAGESGVCPICFATVHTPVTVGSGPLIVRAQSVAKGTVEQPAVAYAVPTLDSPHGRAPPVLV